MWVRQARAAAALVPQVAPATIFLSGTCFPPREPLAEADGHVEYRTAPYAAAPAVISGSVPVYATDLAPVTDPAILAQIQPAARPFVQVMDVRSIAGGALGSWQCRAYMGGEASILPGNLVSSALELIFYGDPTVNADATPLTLARYPNVQAPPHEWLVVTAANGYNITVPVVDNATAARAALWAQQLAEDAGSVWAHFINDLGWASHHNQVVAVAPPAADSLCRGNNCSADPGYDYNGYDITGSPILTGSFAACCAACNARDDCMYFSYCVASDSCGSTGSPVDCYMKSSNAGRQPNSDRVSGAGNATSGATNVSLTLAPCASKYAEPGYDTLTTDGHLYVYNLLAELDQPGEYYLNMTSGLLYVWPPSPSDAIWMTAAWGAAVVPPERPQPPIMAARARALQARDAAASPIGYVSVNDSLIVLTGTQGVSYTDVVIEGAQGAGVIAVNAVNITFNNCLLQNFGNMAVNVTNGSALVLNASVVRHAGNGAVYFYAGDRATLTPANHMVQNSSVSYSNRYMFCYVPSVALGHCGSGVTNSELFGGPHQGVFMEGNIHVLADSYLHDLTQATSDSGSVYTGRDWTYQGTRIERNVFARIASSNGPDVSAVYLDDQVSGYIIVNNTFVNVSRAYLLGGGRDNIFDGNVITGVSGNDAAVHVDNRGMNWQTGMCTNDGELVQFLNRVPYNTSAAWIAAFPHLVNILADDPCRPKYNTIIRNSYCISASGPPFMDQDNATLASWDIAAYDNTPTC